MVEGARDLCGVSFIIALIPFMKAPTSLINHLPKTPPFNTINFGGRTSTYKFGGNTNIQIISDGMAKW